jgi:hypothetical protein
MNDKVQAPSPSIATAVAVVGVLAALFFWFATLVVELDPGSHRFVGGCLAGIGVWYLILHRRIGSQVYSWNRRISRRWEVLGEEASQRFYLAVGMLLSLFGAILILLSMRETRVPPNPRLQRSGASVAALPLAPAAEPPGR